MNNNELIKLAKQADFEGDYELADYIDNQLRKSSNNKNIREAVDYGKIFKPIGSALGKIPEFLGYGKYKAPANWSASAVDLATSNPNRSGNAFQKFFGSVDKEINLDANQVKNLETTLLQQINNSMDQADAATKVAIEKLINKDFKGLLPADKKLIAEFARQQGIVGKRTNADFTDIYDLVRGKSLQVRPRTVQRVNKNTKLLGAAAAGAPLVPGVVGMFSPQAPDTTGSAVPDGPMGMPQLDPMGGGMGGMMGDPIPRAGGLSMGNFAPTQSTGLGYGNTMTDPVSQRGGESYGYAPKSVHTGRNEGEINPAAKYRTNEVGMMRGEPAQVYNYNNYNAGYIPGTQPAVAPVAAPVANVAQQLDIPPVATPTAQGLVGQPNFGGATDSAGIAAELYGDQAPPQPPPMTPGQIQNALNPLSGAGY
jgi:hypothetical protein